MTPTRPLPASCSPLSVGITVKAWSKDVTVRPAGTVALAAVLAVELPHAAATIAIAPRHANQVSDLSLANCVSPPDVLVLLGTIILGARVSNSQAGTRFLREVLTLSNERINQPERLVQSAQRRGSLTISDRLAHQPSDGPTEQDEEIGA